MKTLCLLHSKYQFCMSSRIHRTQVITHQHQTHAAAPPAVLSAERVRSRLQCAAFWKSLLVHILVIVYSYCVRGVTVMAPKKLHFVLLRTLSAHSTIVDYTSVEPGLYWPYTINNNNNYHKVNRLPKNREREGREVENENTPTI